MKAKNEAIRKLISLLIKGVLTIAICIAVLLSGAFTKAWFASNPDVNANGMSVSVAGGKVIYATQQKTNGILNTADASNDVFVTGNNRFTIVLDGETDSENPENRMIGPGSSGELTFSVSCEGASSVSLSFQTMVEVTVNDTTVIQTLEETCGQSSDCTRFTNTHVAFFTQKVNDCYSGWVKHGSDISVALTNGSGVVTVYWVWLETYSMITDVNRVDNEVADDLSDNPGSWLVIPADPGTIDYSNAYDDADTVIGTELDEKKICFRVTLSPNQ